MSRDNPLRGLVGMEELPKLVSLAHAETEPTVPGEPLPVTVKLLWTDGHEASADGWARAWTPTAVLVDASTERGHYRNWVPAERVTRRAITHGPADTGTDRTARS